MPGRASEQPPALPLSVLHLYTLFALVVAQPLLDQLGRNPELFIARGLGRPAALALAVSLLLVVPLPAVVVRLALGRAPTGAQRWADRLLVGMLAAALALRGVRDQLDGLVALAAAMVIGAVCGWVYARLHEARLFVTLLAPALLVVPSLFLWNPLFRGSDSAPPAVRTAVPVPATAGFSVVLVVFDELSLQSILSSSDGAIDADRFPNLAALARRSTFYANATTAASTTPGGVPAILSGRLPQDGWLPRLADYPHNLFTLLEGRYRLRVVEATTALCPAACEPLLTEPAEGGGDVGSLAADLGMVYLHLILPPRYRAALPPIDQTWHHFVPTSGVLWPGYDRAERFRQWVGAITPDSDGTLYFVHSLLPHPPYEFLPSGRNYLKATELEPARHLGFVRELYQRYLLQIGLVDRLLGELVDRLDRLGLFDSALLIVTSDHGPRYLQLPELGQPLADQVQLAEWAFVPLFVKRPGQRQGDVSLSPVSTLDVLPTVLAELELPLPLALDGAPLARADHDRVRQALALDIVRPIPAEARDRLRLALAWKQATFGDGSEPLDLYRRPSAYPQLLGRRLAEVTVVAESSLRVELANLATSVPYDPSSGLAFTRVRGGLELGRRREACCEVVLALNGFIEVSGRSFPQDDDYHRFALLLPESSLRPGNNELDVLVVDPEQPQRLLRPRRSGG